MVKYKIFLLEDLKEVLIVTKFAVKKCADTLCIISGLELNKCSEVCFCAEFSMYGWMYWIESV